MGYKKNVKWSIDVLGRGWSCPVVWGDKIFLTTGLYPAFSKAIFIFLSLQGLLITVYLPICPIWVTWRDIYRKMLPLTKQTNTEKAFTALKKTLLDTKIILMWPN